MKTNHLLNEKYQAIRESITDIPVDINPDVQVVPVAISWKDIGLYEPDNEEDVKETEKAIEEIEELFDGFQKDLDSWQKKYKKLGAVDTVAQEQLAQFVAKNLLGLEKLD